MTKNEELEEKIKVLEINANNLTKEVTEIHNVLENESAPTEKFREDVRKLEKIKAEITSYTLQLITIIIAVFSLILTIIFFVFKDSILKYDDSLIILNVIFIIVLIAWFIVWLLKEDIFSWKLIKKGERINYKKFVSYIDSKNVDMFEYIKTNNSNICDYIKSNNSDILDYVDTKISEIDKK